MPKPNKKIIYGYGISILMIIVLGLLYKDKLMLIFSDPEKVRSFIASFGILSPLILILLQTLQVVIFIIPGPIFTIAGGYSFGVFLGTVYSLIGTMLGSLLVFHLAKRFGRPFVEKMVNKRDLAHFDAFFKKRGKLALLISRTIPVLFPNDAVSFASGLTSLKLKTYLIISLLGFIPNILILNLFGEQLTQNINPIFLILIAVIGIGIMLFMFRHPIKVLLFEEVRKIEEEMKTMEKKSLKEIKIIEKDIKKVYKKI